MLFPPFKQIPVCFCRAEGEYSQNTDGTPERRGQGTHTTADGVVYRGNWSDDKMNGEGVMEFPSGTKYEGMQNALNYVYTVVPR